MAQSKREATVSGRVLGRTFERLEKWRVDCLLGRKRAEVIGLLLDTVISKMEQAGLLDQPLENVVRRLGFGAA